MSVTRSRRGKAHWQQLVELQSASGLPEAKGLAARTVARLKQRWAEEYQHWIRKPLDEHEWVYLWIDGIHSGVRAEDAKLCALTVIGVDEKGHKHLLIIEGGTRESTQSWREILLKLKQRGMKALKWTTDASHALLK